MLGVTLELLLLYRRIKHHHVEGNDRDDIEPEAKYPDFLCYVGRFVFFIWFKFRCTSSERARRSML